MKLEQWKTGDRVKDKFLGNGTIMGKIAGWKSLVMVMFDKTPPEQYNMGENPTAVFTKNLKPSKGS